MLEIAIEQDYRSRCVLAWHTHTNAQRAWDSASSILDDNEAFVYSTILQKVDPIPDNLTADGSSIQHYARFPGTAHITETTMWYFFTWFLTWLCMFKGIRLTVRVVYFTIAMPIILGIVIISRDCSLPNARDGIRIYWAAWHPDKLANGTI